MLKQMHLITFERIQPNLEEQYNKLWSELLSLQEPARKNTKLHQVWKVKKEQLLAKINDIEKEMEHIKK